jgi:hypothetical protein
MNLPPFDTASVKTPRGSATGEHRKRRLTRQLRVKVSAADLCFENVNYAPANLLVLVVLSLSFCGVGGTLSVPIPPARWRTKQGSLDERRPAGRPSAAAFSSAARSCQRGALRKSRTPPRKNTCCGSSPGDAN